MMTVDNITLATSTFVLATAEGHAIAVATTKGQALDWAAVDARRFLHAGEVLSWTVQYNEATPEYTLLDASTTAADADVIASYVITELDAAADGPNVTTPAPAKRSRNKDTAATPQAPETPPDPETHNDASDPAAAPQADTEPPENAESEAVPDPEPLPACGGSYEGCNGTVESAQQLNLSTFKQLVPLCDNCYRHEIAEGIGPRMGEAAAE